MTDDDVARLLDLRIRRISAYDLKKNRGEIDDIVAAMRQVNRKLKNLTKTVIEWLNGLDEKYGEQFPRRTEIETFHPVDKVAVAKANIRLSYDREAGYFGSSMRGSEFVMTVTEYDRILAVTADGTYRIMAPPEKAWMPGALLYAGIFDKAKGAHFTLIYRDANGLAWGKRVHVERFITGQDLLAREGRGAGDRVPCGEESHGDREAEPGPGKETESEIGERGSCKDSRVRADGAWSEANGKARPERGADPAEKMTERPRPGG